MFGKGIVLMKYRIQYLKKMAVKSRTCLYLFYWLMGAFGKPCYRTELLIVNTVFIADF